MPRFRLGSRFRLRALATAILALGASGLLPSPQTPAVAAAAAPQPPTALQLQALERAFNGSGELSAI
ncbi:MAG: hypothetical protein NTW02_08515, partial [Cyanobium sp. LacPavin_0920_WC12_MAG_62_9]|nr:hypothetical protein [Cyanobium sp. LacPavin_0920_WC12_MAG_62_9]